MARWSEARRAQEIKDLRDHITWRKAGLADALRAAADQSLPDHKRNFAARVATVHRQYIDEYEDLAQRLEDGADPADLGYLI